MGKNQNGKTPNKDLKKGGKNGPGINGQNANDDEE